MLKGIDISHLNSNDWKAFWAKLSHDFEFVWLKATQGGVFKDPAFNDNWQYLKTINKKRGAYIFWDCRFNAQQHWENLASLDIDFSKPNVMPLMVDIENQATPALDKMVSQNHAKYVSEITELLSLIKQHTGRKAGVYCDPSYFKDYLGGASWPDSPLWIAAIQDHPPHLPKGWNNWTFWQYSWKGQTNDESTGGQIDLDYFNGTLEELAQL